ncbi:MAG: hypothetical protein IPI22_07545 [Bacteroidetes bacterium]|nr:hypothetical protein [Bacteroidota bacterium]
MLGKNAFIYVVISIGLLFTACNKEASLSDDTYTGSKVMILGHRGMGTGYYKPHNTLDAILPVLGIGADGSEMDIQLTKDSVLVLFHDYNLSPMTTCNGSIYQQNWEEVKQCKYYSLHNNVFVNSVENLFSQIPNLTNMYFSFDSKIDGAAPDFQLYQKQFLRAIQRLCIKYQMSEHVMIEGDINLLLQAQSLGLTNKLFLSADLSLQSIEDAYNNHFAGISASINSLGAQVPLAHQKGLLVMAWSPNNYSQKETLSRQVDIIQSDDPMSLLKLLNRYNYEYIIP